MSFISKIRANDGLVADVVYDESHGVSFKLKFIDKSTLLKLNGQFSRMKFNPRTQTKDEELDIDGLKRRLYELGVLGWSGVTARWLSTVMAINLDLVDDIDKEIPFTQEDLIEITDSTAIDGWLIENIKEISNFNGGQIPVEEQLKN